MAARGSKFDWSLLERESLANFVWSIFPKLTDKELTAVQFHSILIKHLKSQLPIKIAKKHDEKVDFDWVYTGGTYYSDLDRERKTCIELVFVYNTFQDKITMPVKRFHKMCYLIADTLLHELMHMRQYRRRQFKVLPDYASTAEKQEQRSEQAYLGCSDEIDAYSFNIACELMGKFKNDADKVVNYLNTDQTTKRRRHNSWRMYLRAFGHNHDHIIIRRIKKKIIRYLPQALIGKPYRNKDWINH